LILDNNGKFLFTKPKHNDTFKKNKFENATLDECGENHDFLKKFGKKMEENAEN
jgi:hypothetical protein